MNRMLALEWGCVNIYSLSSDGSRVVDIVASDAIATKKKVFIRGSPLAWQKKGLGEGSLPALMYRTRRRIVSAEIVVKCNAGGTRTCFANQVSPAVKADRAIPIGIAIFFHRT